MAKCDHLSIAIKIKNKMDSTYPYEKNQESREKQQKLFTIFLAWTQLI